MNIHGIELCSAVMGVITDVWDRTKQIDDAVDEVLDLIEADRKRRGNPVSKIDPNPPPLSIVWHDSPESVDRAMWEQAAIEAGVTYEDLIEGSNVGETEDGGVLEFTHEQAIDGMRTQGCWGFVDTKTNTINAWAADDVDASTALHFLAHEIGHVTGEQLDDMQEEMRAEQFGRVAALAYRLWCEKKNVAPQPAESVKVPEGYVLVAEKYLEEMIGPERMDHLRMACGFPAPKCTPNTQPAEPVSKTDWNSKLSSWSDEDLIFIFHEYPDLADRLRKILAEPVKIDVDDLAQEIRRVDGKHSLGATALAEALLPFLSRAAEPVKVPSDDIDIEDVRQYLDSWGCLAHPGVRALLASYGKGTP